MSNIQSLAQNEIWNLIQHKQLCDVEVVTPDRSFMAHSLLLAACSPVLKNMLFEIEAGAVCRRIVVDNVSAAEMDELVKILYGNNRPCWTDLKTRHMTKVLQLDYLFCDAKHREEGMENDVLVSFYNTAEKDGGQPLGLSRSKSIGDGCPDSEQIEQNRKDEPCKASDTTIQDGVAATSQNYVTLGVANENQDDIVSVNRDNVVSDSNSDNLIHEHDGIEAIDRELCDRNDRRGNRRDDIGLGDTDCEAGRIKTRRNRITSAIQLTQLRSRSKLDSSKNKASESKPVLRQTRNRERNYSDDYDGTFGHCAKKLKRESMIRQDNPKRGSLKAKRNTNNEKNNKPVTRSSHFRKLQRSEETRETKNNVEQDESSGSSEVISNISAVGENTENEVIDDAGGGLLPNSTTANIKNENNRDDKYIIEDIADDVVTNVNLQDAEIKSENVDSMVMEKRNTPFISENTNTTSFENDNTCTASFENQTENQTIRFESNPENNTVSSENQAENQTIRLESNPENSTDSSENQAENQTIRFESNPENSTVSSENQAESIYSNKSEENVNEYAAQENQANEIDMNVSLDFEGAGAQDTKLLKCDHCGAEFKRRQTLAKHKVLCFDESALLKCSQCDTLVASKHALKLHMKRVHGNKYKCVECEMTFGHKQDLTKHEQSHQQQQGKLYYNCSVCDKSFETRSGFFNHQKSHGEKEYQCPECDKAFYRKFSLQEHMKIHTGDKPYLCTYCGKGFSKTSNLKAHQVMHTGAQPFSCEYCQKTFSYLSTLTTHVRMHFDDRPFTCDICGKAYPTKSGLNAHKKIHGTKLLACDICDKTFHLKSNLNKHKLIHQVSTDDQVVVNEGILGKNTNNVNKYVTNHGASRQLVDPVEQSDQMPIESVQYEVESSQPQIASRRSHCDITRTFSSSHSESSITQSNTISATSNLQSSDFPAKVAQNVQGKSGVEATTPNKISIVSTYDTAQDVGSLANRTPDRLVIDLRRVNTDEINEEEHSVANQLLSLSVPTIKRIPRESVITDNENGKSPTRFSENNNENVAYISEHDAMIEKGVGSNSSVNVSGYVASDNEISESAEHFPTKSAEKVEFENVGKVHIKTENAAVNTIQVTREWSDLVPNDSVNINDHVVNVHCKNNNATLDYTTNKGPVVVHVPTDHFDEVDFETTSFRNNLTVENIQQSNLKLAEMINSDKIETRSEVPTSRPYGVSNTSSEASTITNSKKVKVLFPLRSRTDVSKLDPVVLPIVPKVQLPSNVETNQAATNSTILDVSKLVPNSTATSTTPTIVRVPQNVPSTAAASAPRIVKCSTKELSKSNKIVTKPPTRYFTTYNLQGNKSVTQPKVINYSPIIKPNAHPPLYSVTSVATPSLVPAFTTISPKTVLTPNMIPTFTIIDSPKSVPVPRMAPTYQTIAPKIISTSDMAPPFTVANSKAVSETSVVPTFTVIDAKTNTIRINTPTSCSEPSASSHSLVQTLDTQTSMSQTSANHGAGDDHSYGLHHFCVL